VLIAVRNAELSIDVPSSAASNWSRTCRSTRDTMFCSETRPMFFSFLDNPPIPSPPPRRGNSSLSLFFVILHSYFPGAGRARIRSAGVATGGERPFVRVMQETIPGAAAGAAEQSAAPARRGWLRRLTWAGAWLAAGVAPMSGWETFIEVPLVDFSEFGDATPWRVGVTRESRRDPIARLLRHDGVRWVATLGYSEVRDVFVREIGTPVRKARGRATPTVSLARRWFWEVPVVPDGWSLDAGIEFGVHYAARSVPADGTHFQFVLAPGLDLQPVDGPWRVGLRWLHLSNGNVRPGNSGYDGLSLQFGCRFGGRK